MDEAVDKEMVAEAWETPPPATMPTTLLASPVLHLDGFDGPMDLLLDLAERQKIDFGRMSIIDLAVQFVAALERHGAQVPLERRADWLVLATRLVLLRTRLLFPANAAEERRAGAAAAAEMQRLEDRLAFRAAGAWLTARPQLGIETFARPPREVAREGGYVALMEACLTLLRALPPAAPAPDQPYRPVIPDLWRVVDALAYIPALLAANPEGGALASFLPPIASDDPDRTTRTRTALGSTFLASLELARQGRIALTQDQPMAECRVRAVCTITV
jgi:segregation and condensation protein A